MLFSKRAALLALLSTGVVAACTAPSLGVGSSTDDHTEGQLLTQNDPHVWAEIAPADFARGIGSISEDGAPPVAQNDVATLRVQTWLDRFHTIVTKVLADRGERLTAPKPTAALFKANFPNAWVSATMGCPSWTLRSQVGGGSNASFYLSETAAQVTDLRDRCIRPVNWTDPMAFGRFWNSHQPACELGWDSSSSSLVVLNGDGCSIYGTQGTLTTYATASMIGMTLDAVSWGEEKRVAMTLAHELGHYYRAHSNPTVRNRLNFFYQEAQNLPAVPVPIADSARYEQIVNAIRGIPAPIRLTATTRYNKRLPRLLLALRSMCPSAQISDASMRSVAQGQGTQQQIAEYLAFENAIAVCGQSLSLSDQTTVNSFAQILSDQRLNPNLATSAATVEQALSALSQRFDQIDVGERELVAKVDAGTLGWYTDEQEADEIGLELAARAGFYPAEMMNASLRTFEQIEEVYRLNGASSGAQASPAQCKRWLAAGFMETGADGVSRPVKVPLGSLSDTHHEGCYRVYNLWREAKKHNYTVAAPLPAISPVWSNIQQRAIDLGANRPPNLPNEPLIVPGGLPGGATPPGGGTTTPGGGTTPPGGGTTPPGGGTTTPGGGTTPPGGGTTNPGGGTTSPGGGTTNPGGDAGSPTEPNGGDDDSNGDPWYNTPKKKPTPAATTPDAGAPAPAVVVTEGGCSTAPGTRSGTGTFLAGIAAAALVLARRRRRSAQ